MPTGPARHARRLAAHPQRRAAERAAGGPPRRRPPRPLRRRGARQPARRARLGRPCARRARRRDPAGARRRPARADRRRPRRRAARRAARACRTTSVAARVETADRRGPCCGATSCCARPTRCAAPSGTPPVSAGRATELRLQLPRGPGRGARRARPGGAGRAGAARRGPAGRPPARRPRGRRPHPRPPAAAARAAGPHRRPERRAAPRDRAAAARRPPVRAAPAAARSPRSRRRDQGPLDRRAAGAALESVGRVGELLTRPRGGAGRAAAQRRRRGARPEAAGPRAARRPSPRPAWLLELAYAAGLLDVGGPHRDEWLPTRSLRRLARAGPARPLGGARRRLADRRAAALAGRAARRRGQGGQPAVPRPGPPHRAGDPALGADRAGRVPARLRAWPTTTWSRLLRWRTPRRADRLAPVPGDARRGRAAGRRRRRGAVHRRPRPADLR